RLCGGPPTRGRNELKELNLLRPPLFGDDEIFGAKVGHRLSPLVRDDHVDCNELRFRPERGRRLGLLLGGIRSRPEYAAREEAGYGRCVPEGHGINTKPVRELAVTAA